MAVSVRQALRRVRGPRPRPAPGGGGGGGGGSTVTLSFASSTVARDGGVEGVVAAPNATISLAFSEVTPRVGLPRYLNISESGTLKLVVTFPADYDGVAYTYTDSAGLTHPGTFPAGVNGAVNF